MNSGFYDVFYDISVFQPETDSMGNRLVKTALGQINADLRRGYTTSVT